MKAEEILNRYPALKRTLESKLLRADVVSLMEEYALEYAEHYHTQQPVNSQGVSDEESVYLIAINDEETIVVADSIADAMDKAEKVSKNYYMIHSYSLPVLPTPPTEKPTEQKTEGE